MKMSPAYLMGLTFVLVIAIGCKSATPHPISRPTSTSTHVLTVTPTPEPSLTATPEATAGSDPQTGQYNCGVSPLDVPIVVPWKPSAEMNCHAYYHAETGGTVEILSFTSDAERFEPGDSVTLTWDTRGSELVVLEVYDAEQVQQIKDGGSGQLTTILFFDWLPPSGGKTVTIPDGVQEGVRLVLWTANRRAGSPWVAFERMAYSVLDLLPNTR